MAQNTRNRRITTMVPTLALAAFVATGCQSNAAGGGDDGLIQITAGVATSQSSTALLLGVEQGFFEEEGLDVTVDYAAQGAAAIPQLINGQMQVALGALSPVISAVAQDVPVHIVSGSVNDREDPEGTQYQTMVAEDSGIETFADLEGKTVAVNSLSCCWEFWIREAMEAEGADHNTVEFVQLPFAEAVTALRQGEVDAISTAQPFATSLRQEHFRDIGDSASIAFGNPEAGFTVFYMSEQFIADNPGVVESWRAALAKSSEYANEHPEETRAQIVEQTGADADLAASAPLPLYSAEIDRDAVEAEGSFLEKYGVFESVPSVDEIVAP